MRCRAESARLVLLLALAFVVWGWGSDSSAATVVSTSTTSDAFDSASSFHVHYAAGYYWVAFHDGTRPVLFSSRDGVTWSSQGALFSTFNAATGGLWVTRFLGTNVIALGFDSGTTNRYYRNATLNSDGTVTWSGVETVAQSGATATPMNAIIANLKPVYWRASAPGAGQLARGSALNGPSWANPPVAPALAPTTGGRFWAGAAFAIGGGDPGNLILIRATTQAVTTAGSHRLVSVKYDASANSNDGAWFNVSTAGGLSESAVTEVKEAADNVAQRHFAAVQDASGNIHAVYVNRNDDVVHYEKASGFNDNWSRISSDVTQTALAIDRVALAASGDNVFLFYSKSDNGIYYRRFDGATWGAESVLKAADANPLQGALAAMESGDGCSLGLAWEEGAGSPYNVMFSLGIGSCAALSTSSGSGTITVTSPGSFEMTFDLLAGGSIRKFYDLAEDPSKLYDLAGALAGTASPQGLHNSGMRVGATNYNAGTNSVGSKLDLLEATPTRVRVRQESFYENNGTGVLLAGVKGIGDYSVYPAGRIAFSWNRRTTQVVSYVSEYHELMVHETAAPLDNWATYSETALNAGTDDFLLAQKEVPSVRTDFLNILYQDWTAANGYSETADLTGWTHDAPAERVNLYWLENTLPSLAANASERWNFLTYFKPTSFVDNSDAAVKARRDDYRGPDDISGADFAQGGRWDEDGNNDGFNEAEAAYTFDLDPLAGLTFDMDGSTTTHYSPFFKIRQWRSLAPPSTVTLEGATLSRDLEYKADVKPVARAHWAASLSWHSTLESAAAAVTPDVGTGTGASGSISFVAARYGKGARIIANGDTITFPGANLNVGSGAVEFWYQPNYAHTDGVRHGLWANDPGDGTHFFLLEKTVGNALLFTIRNGGTTNTRQVASTDYSWRANDWVHLRAEWNSAAVIAADRLRLFVNGVEPNHTDAGSFSSIGMVAGPNYIGTLSTGLSPASGIIDEFRMYQGVSAPTLLARGGLTSDASEYLGSGSRNFSLSFSAVDGSARGQYFYIGADSKFRGLNVALATAGIWSVAGDLVWQYWNGTAWGDLETSAGIFTDETNNFTKSSGTIDWTADPAGWSPYSVNGGPDLYYVRAHLAFGGSYATWPQEGLIKTDILLFQYCGDISLAAQTFSFPLPVPTAVELTTFEAASLDGAAELRWETATELKNLGFHLYRAESEVGPYERITSSVIPGLGSSPVGATYRYVDRPLENGRTYYYQLEDIETTGATQRHGPVAVTPLAGSPRPAEFESDAGDEPVARIAYGKPDQNELKIIRRTNRALELELVTRGFYAESSEDGSVRVEIPGFAESETVALPVARQWISAVPGHKVTIASVRAGEMTGFASLRPQEASAPELIASGNGSVTARRRRAGRKVRAVAWLPAQSARLVSAGFQGEEKKALVELAPLRWDGAREELVLAQRLRVRISFAGVEPSEETTGVGRGRRRVVRPAAPGDVVVRLATHEPGLYAVRFQDLPFRDRSLSPVALLRGGKPVPYHLEPSGASFGPGSVLYFESDGARANPYGNEAVYELVRAQGVSMAVDQMPPRGEPVPVYSYRAEREENHFYQAALLDAEDVWLWDSLLSGETKRYGVEASGVAPGEARVRVWLQGTSDFPTTEDHHIRVMLNGLFVGEAVWDGRTPRLIEGELDASALVEGNNLLELENVGDTAAQYSMVMLDRFDVTYPRWVETSGSVFDGTLDRSGTVEVAARFVLDESAPAPHWVAGEKAGTGTRFSGEAGHRYLAVTEALRPDIRMPVKTSLRDTNQRADWILVGPKSFLDAAQPLVELRRSQGLKVKAVSMEEIAETFGQGESTPEAVRDFVAYAYQEWRRPSVRYLLLLGDATYDFKDYLGTGVKNQVPPFMVKTSYLWTASDPAYAEVNGDDPLPDLAVGRLPAASVSEVQVMVSKIVSYETASGSSDSPVVLVADDADGAGDFAQHAEELSRTVLAGLPQRKIYFERVGSANVRGEVLSALDEGAFILSYIGHGGINLWATENVFNTGDVARLSAQPDEPLLLTMNCLNGYFHFPYFDSLAEAMVKADGRGAIAAFSPTGLSLDEPAHHYHRAVLQAVLDGRHPRLGDAILDAQRSYAETGLFPELLSIYHLLGDPALVLRR